MLFLHSETLLSEQLFLDNPMERDKLERLLAADPALREAADLARAQGVPFDVELGFPNELGRRMARNTQLLLIEESHVGQVIDPAGGAWYVESYTEELAEQAWSRFAAI